jgi:SAM-dependent methyltransferase
LQHDPYLHDPDRWGASLVQLAELLLPCLDAVEAGFVVEIGALAGDLTRVLADWAAERGARVTAVDPSPLPPLEALAREAGELELDRRTSLEALPEIPLPDVVILDGDHNYFTVSEELRIIGERAPDDSLPLILLHDVGWPHARRDDYYAVELIPEPARRPTAGTAGGLFPGDPGIRPGGLPYPRSARQEGGPRNGVLTALEDFMAAREGLQTAVVPSFLGFGAVWPRDAAWAGAVARILEPWDRNPLLERLEANRVHHLARGHARLVALQREQARRSRQEAVLRRMLDSSAFAIAERLSRLRVRAGVARGQSVISKDEIRRALAD